MKCENCKWHKTINAYSCKPENYGYGRLLVLGYDMGKQKCEYYAKIPVAKINEAYYHKKNGGNNANNNTDWKRS